MRPNSSTSNSSMKKKKSADSTHHLRFFKKQGESFSKADFKPCVTESSGILDIWTG